MLNYTGARYLATAICPLPCKGTFLVKPIRHSLGRLVYEINLITQGQGRRDTGRHTGKQEKDTFKKKSHKTFSARRISGNKAEGM